jgi:uncharacterized OB-fold protein
MAPLPVPRPEPVTQAWWDATVERRFTAQRCRSCNKIQHYPRPFCISCQADELDFVELSGKGKVQSFSIVYRSPFDDLPAPYVVALVDLAEGIRIFTRIVDCDPQKVRCDMAVTLTWLKSPGDNPYNLPAFAPEVAW